MQRQEAPVAVITGASSGIGAAAARRLAAQGWTVVAVGRSPERTAAVAAELGTEPVVADFGSLDQVRAAAETILGRYPRIDVLANNAGGIVPQRTESADGHELTFQANHLAGHLLTRLFLPSMERHPGARVIWTSSFGNRFARVHMDDLEWQRRRYGNGWLVYCATKLMNILEVRELARRHSSITALAFHPDPGPDAVAGPGGGERRHEADRIRLRHAADADGPAAPLATRRRTHGGSRRATAGLARHFLAGERNERQLLRWHAIPRSHEPPGARRTHRPGPLGGLRIHHRRLRVSNAGSMRHDGYRRAAMATRAEGHTSHPTPTSPLPGR